MRPKEPSRSSIRLRIRDGEVLLRYAGVPSLTCPLVDLSEGGCCCHISLGKLAPETGEAWEQVIETGRLVHLELSLPPYLNHFPLEAEIRSASPLDEGDIELGLKFQGLSGEQAEHLKLAIIELAAIKVRRAVSQAAGRRPESGGTTPESRGGAVQTGVVSAESEARSAAPAAVVPDSEPRTPDPVPQAGAADVSQAPPPGLTPAARAAVPPPAGRAGTPVAAPAPGGGTAVLSPFRGKKIGEILVHLGKLSQSQVDEAVPKARQGGVRLGRYLMREGLLSPEDLCRALSLQSGLPMTDLSSASVPAHLARLFPYELMHRHGLVPIDESPKMVCIAAGNVPSQQLVAQLEQLCKRRIQAFLACEDLVLRATDSLLPPDPTRERAEPRYAVATPVTYRLCNRLGRLSEPTVYTGKTLDVSESGVLIEAQAPRAVGPEDVRRRGLCFRVSVAWGDRHIEALCDPRAIEARPAGEAAAFPWRVGLRILEIRKADRDLLRELCLALRLQAK